MTTRLINSYDWPQPGDKAGMPDESALRILVEHFCIREDLSTDDPYDVWKTPLGYRVKDLYNRHPAAGLIPAAAVQAFDCWVNNNRRRFYTRQEYPIVRAMAALSLLNLFSRHRHVRFLNAARQHLQWLVCHRCTGYHGYCWGLGIPWAVSRDVIYDSNTPLATMTPYALEAFVRYAELSGDDTFQPVICAIYPFFERDLQIMHEDETTLAISYGPWRDRIVTNAVSYALYSRTLLLPYLSPSDAAASEAKARKLFAYVKQAQREDGSWFYSPSGRSFIDCFHSCIVLANILKTARRLPLPGAEEVVARGYEYLKGAVVDPRYNLCRRFAVANKPSPIKFDLYDNAEMLNLAHLMGDRDLNRRILASVRAHFVDGMNVYSNIDIFGIRRNRNMLRWAVMPFLRAVSQYP
jgi:hypothetical protein